jgi:hypothetical protein
MLNFFKSNFFIEKTKLNRDLIEETREYDCFKFLYNDFVIEDFAEIGKDNYLNKDYEDHVFNDFDYLNIYDILNDEIINKFALPDKNINFLNLASGSGKFTIFSSIFYKFNSYVGVENIFELYKFSSYILDKLRGSEYNNLIKNDSIIFNNEGLLNAEIGDFDIILIDYNNNNYDFNQMLKNKIDKEAKRGTLLIKIIEPFEKNIEFTPLKTKLLRVDGGNLFVYYYLVK